MENIEELWAMTLSRIEQKVSKPSFDTWLRDTKAEHFDDDHFIVSVQNDFVKDWLEGHYTGITNELLQE